MPFMTKYMTNILKDMLNRYVIIDIVMTKFINNHA